MDEMSSIPDESAQTSIYFSDAENESQVADVISIITKQCNIEKEDIVVMGNMSADSRMPTVAGHMIWLFRKHNVQRNEREMIMSFQESVVTVQLCLAEANKQKCGEFDVEVSKVIEMHKHLNAVQASDKYRLDQEFTELKENYQKYLKQCNLTDCLQVLSKLKEEIINNESLKNDIDKKHFLILNSTANPIELAIIEWFACGKKSFTICSETSLDDSLIDVGSLHLKYVHLEEIVTNFPSNSFNTPGNTGGRSISETYAEKVLMAYLHLVVNTRCELALSLVLNIPERGLSHKAFTAVKKEAKLKKISMYQAIISHVMRLRLGGKSYVPNSESPLNPYVKGLAEFTDLMHKLSNIVEEETNTRKAIKRILNILKNTILRSQDTNLRSQSIESITEKLLLFSESTIENYESKAQPSPKRDPYHGGSLIGRQTLRVIQAIVDRYSSKLPGITSHVDLLTDVFSSQTTPVRFPSLLSQFRSPVEASHKSENSKSLAMRMKDKLQSSKENFPQVKRFQSNMSWAVPVHDAEIKSTNNQIFYNMHEDYVPSKTIVHPANKLSQENRTVNKVLESMHDKENAIDPGSNICQNQKDKRKRTKTGNSNTNEPLQKKSKKTSQPKAKKLPLQKGQKQLTSFFRV